MALKTVDVPQEFEPVFARAEEVVASYFAGRSHDPSRAAIEIGGDRYILVRAEQTVKQQRQFLETILDTVQAEIVACDADGVLTLFNRATREFHGLPEERIPAEQWSEQYNAVEDAGLCLLQKPFHPDTLLHTVRAMLAEEGPCLLTQATC